MKINYLKVYDAINNDEKLPRKVKKRILGIKLNKNKLRKLLNSVEIIKSASTMYENPIIKPYAFCPKCGCVEMKGTGNLSAYPEHWEYFHCLRCNYIVAYIDNSPFIHALEAYEYDYDPTF